MKKILFSALLAASLSSFGESLEIVVAKDSAKLVFPAGETTGYAAQFLARHIQAATGIKPVITYSAPKHAAARKIYLGETAKAKALLGDLHKLSPEELVIAPAGKDLVICGEISKNGLDRGTLFGVYEFLERALGIRFLYPEDPKWAALGKGTFIPKNQKLEFPEKTLRLTPYYRRREGGVSYNFAPLDVQKQWHPILRFGDTLPHQNANHTQIGWVDLYGKTHPEYFARNAAQKPVINWRLKTRTYICLSNPAVLQQMLNNVEAYDRNDPAVKTAFGPRPPEPGTVYFCTNDGMTLRNVCKCPDCSAKMKKGSEGELFWSFAEKYASQVRQRWPGRRFTTLAYSFWITPPVQAKVPENMDITYVGPQVHYSAEPLKKKRYQDQMNRWFEFLGKDPERMTNWLNIVSPSTYTSAVPFQYPHLLQDMLRFTKGKSAGYFINGFNPYRRGKGEAPVLNAVQTFPMVWLQGRMLWDPDGDPDALMREYCSVVFGNAGNEMFQLFAFVARRWETLYQANKTISELDFIHQVRFPQESVAQMQELLRQAKAKAKGDPELLKKLDYYEKSVYGRFFRESADYHRRDGKIMAYECCSVRVSGGEKIPWELIPETEFSRSRMGDKAKRRTALKMAHSQDTLYLLAKFENPRDKEELRIQNASGFSPMRSMYAPNINRDWKFFREVRIDRTGAIRYFGKLRGVKAHVTEANRSLLFEVAIPLKSLSGGANLRMQFMRYWDVWNDFDLWSPTFTGISDYPTWRFGLVQLLPETEEVSDGLL